MKNKVGIVGFGWVGKAMHELFPDALVYSPGIINDGYHVIEGYPKDEWKKQYSEEIKKQINEECSIVFVCVPTPCPEKGRLDVSAVEESVAWLEVDVIVVRSTVNPGDCDYLRYKYKKNICMQPEYLGETPQHPLLDSAKTPFLVIGGDNASREKLINLYTKVYNANIKIRQTSCLGAEIIKLSENRAIAWKVMECQELYDICKKANLDYYTVRDAVYGDDPRFNLWWTMVYPDNRGFHSSKCLKKDPYAFCAWAESLGYDPKLTKALIAKSEEYAELDKQIKAE